jgi:hypothetical protein
MNILGGHDSSYGCGPTLTMTDLMTLLSLSQWFLSGWALEIGEMIHIWDEVKVAGWWSCKGM